MAKVYATPWHRYKFLLSGLLLILPFVFLYQSLNPTFPDALPEQAVGDYVIAPMPYDLDGPYQHDGQYVKDFLLTFKQGNISNIRQAFLSISKEPMAATQLRMVDEAEGFLHGSRHGQHVHALAKQTISADDRIWLTIENWNGNVLTANWAIPAAMTSNH